MTRVLIEVPLFDAGATPICKESIDALDTTGVEVDYRQRYGYGVDAARNRIAAHALAGGYDWLLMVDADNTLPRDALQNLLEHGADVCLGWYLNRHDHGDAERTCLYRPGPRWSHYRASELWSMRRSGEYTLRVRGGGMGCCLVRPAVFDALRFPWFEWRDLGFDRVTGRVRSCGEDIDFFLKCERAGIPIYADTRVECGHVRP